MRKPKIYLNHLGFLCNATKRVIVDACDFDRFEVQDMMISEVESLDGHENWKTVYTGELKKVSTDMGDYLVGDFSGMNKPGFYRVVLPGVVAHSFQFAINDGVFAQLPRLFLNFIHSRRSGDFENDWRGPSHLDDAIRSDTGEQIDCVGGWYDAGDLRKWMSMTMLPALGFLDIYEQLGMTWNHFASEGVTDNDLLTETIWGIEFILKMQDPETGMLFEEIGGGGEARRKPGMNWWYENHSGCYADNSQNYFTDNIPNSGDERIVRVQYNPIVQYTNLTILLRAAEAIELYDKSLSQESKTSARRVWDYTQTVRADDRKHSWASVRAWRLCAGIEMARSGLIPELELNEMAAELIELFAQDFGFWHMTIERKEPYRGVLHSAQPIIALAKLLHHFPSMGSNLQVADLIQKCWDRYIQPMLSTNPFGLMPYGLFTSGFTDKDRYRAWRDGLSYRFYMPDNSPQQINHGLGGHWTSWAHALAFAGELLGNRQMQDAAWDQLYWLLGKNLKNSCVISGVGYNNPMPHSRFFGTIIGGFCVGPVGNTKDEFVLDLDARAAWNTTEYWNPPVANTLMAFAHLLPKKVKSSGKIP